MPRWTVDKLVAVPRINKQMQIYCLELIARTARYHTVCANEDIVGEGIESTANEICCFLIIYRDYSTTICTTTTSTRVLARLESIQSKATAWNPAPRRMCRGCQVGIYHRSPRWQHRLSSVAFVNSLLYSCQITPWSANAGDDMYHLLNSVDDLYEHRMIAAELISL